VSDVIFLTFGFYLAIILVASAAAFVFSLFAAQYDWHLRTNLKGMLWAGAGLAFALLMLFSSQVANIKVLQEKEIEFYFGQGTLDYAGSRVVYQGHSYIDIDKDGISLSNISGGPDYGIAYLPPREDGYYVRRYASRYPRYGGLYKNVGNNVYSLAIHAYSRSEGERPSVKTFYEKVYLRSYKRTGESWILACELDISDCLTNNKRWIRMSMRLIDNRLFVHVNNSYVLVDAMNPGELKLIDKKLDVLQRYRPFTYKDRKKEFSIPLVPIEEFGLEERIRLSIDLNYRFYYENNPMYESSIVDIHDGKFAFFFVTYDDNIARFDVTRWDDEKIYCRFSVSRPFTILEGVTGVPRSYHGRFVKNGKLYCHGDKTLLVFDIRSNRKIRKLGHFVRMNYYIDDMAVLEDGNILLCVRLDQDQGSSTPDEQKNYLYLLKNPE
jgi:hypothetical protein